MIIKPETSTRTFNFISVDKFLSQFQKSNPDINTDYLKEDLNYFKKLKSQGQKCDCGNTIWIIGSAISGLGCFTCITGETDCSEDYEVK